MGKHAIIIIKNNNNEYLQYYDNIWKSFLFLNCKLFDDKENENNIKKYFKSFKGISIRTWKRFYLCRKSSKDYSRYRTFLSGFSIL